MNSHLKAVAIPTEPAGRRRWRRIALGSSGLEIVFAAIFLILGMAANIRYLQSDPIWAGIYVVAAALLILRAIGQGLSVPVNLTTVSLFMFLTLMSFSVAWSETPWNTVRSFVALSGTTLLGIYLYYTFSCARTFRLLFLVLSVVMAVSALMVVGLPDVALHIETLEREWRGLFLHKNALGPWMAVLIGLSTVLLRWKAISRVTGSLTVILAAILLYGSDSMEGQVLSILLVGIALVLPKSRKGTNDLWLITFLVSLAALAILIVSANWSLQYLATDPPVLSGRTQIWKGVIEALEARPILGYGYGGFWHGEDGPSSVVMRRMDGYVPWHAHNGLLEVMLAGGLVGLLIFAVFTICFVMNSWRLLMERPSLEAHLLLVFAASVLLQSLVSNPVPVYQSSSWMLMVAFSLHVESLRATGRTKKRRRRVVVTS